MRVLNFLKAVYRIVSAIFHLYWLVPAIVILCYPDRWWRLLVYVVGLFVGIRLTIMGTKSLHNETIKKVLNNEEKKTPDSSEK